MHHLVAILQCSIETLGGPKKKYKSHRKLG
jgi:hypothetical protein